MTGSKRFDKVALGLVAGLVLPLLSLLVLWLVRYEGELGEFLTSFQKAGMLSKVISLSAIPNLLLFFVFIWTNRTYSARGVIFATLVTACIVVTLKIIDGSLG